MLLLIKPADKPNFLPLKKSLVGQSNRNLTVIDISHFFSMVKGPKGLANVLVSDRNQAPKFASFAYGFKLVPANVCRIAATIRVLTF